MISTSGFYNDISDIKMVNSLFIHIKTKTVQLVSERTVHLIMNKIYTT